MKKKVSITAFFLLATTLIIGACNSSSLDPGKESNSKQEKAVSNNSESQNPEDTALNTARMAYDTTAKKSDTKKKKESEEKESEENEQKEKREKSN